MDHERESLRRLRLRRVTILAALDDARLDELVSDCEWTEIPSGHAIIVQDDPSDRVAFLVEGEAATTVTASDGREVAYEQITSPQLVGEIAALDGGQRSSTVIADADCVVAWLDGAAFRDLMGSEPTVALAVCRRLCGTARYLMDRLYNTQLVPMNDRILMELVKVAQKHSADGVSANVLSAPTHSELAHRAGTHREAVTKLIAILRKEGILAGSRRTLVVPDIPALENKIESELRHRGVT